MKFIKNTLIMLTLCTINALEAKRTGAQPIPTKTTTTTQPPITTPPTKPITQPITAPITTPIVSKTGPTYEEILNMLKNKKPNESNFSTLNAIKSEIENQIDAISIIQRPIIETYPQHIIEAYAQQLANEYQIPLTVNEKNAFSAETQRLQAETIQNIMQQFIKQYPKVDQNTAINTIDKAIRNTQNFKNFIETINDPSRKLARITDIYQLIANAWDSLHQ